MTEISTSPDVSQLEIPMDRWTAPFWQAASERRLAFPRCSACGRFRWPAGPFCPDCHSQDVEWADAGEGRVYSFSAVRTAATETALATLHLPALIEFPGAGGVRLLAALVGAVPEAVEIGAAVVPDWLPAANAVVPIFRLKD